MVKHLDANFYYHYNASCYYRNKFDREAVLNNKDAENKLMNCLLNPEFIENAKYIQEKDIIVVRSNNFKVTINSVSKYLEVPGMKEFYYNLLVRQGIIKKTTKKHGKFKLQPNTIVKGTAVALILSAVLTVFVSRTEIIDIDGTTRTPTEIVHQIKDENPLAFEKLDVEVSENDDIEYTHVSKTQEPTIENTKEEPTTIETTEPTTKVEYIEETIITRQDNFSEGNKVKTIKDNYFDIINNMCEVYELDTNLMLAIISREADTDGYHSTRTDKAAIGLCQLEKGVWLNYHTNYYNPHNGSWENITIGIEDLQDLYKNISLACRYFKKDCLPYANFANGDLNDPNGNIFVAIQCYNFGFGNMDKALGEYARIKGCSIQDVIENKDDLGWLDYLSVPKQGNPNYIQGVMSFIDIDLFADEFGITSEQLNQIDGINAKVEKRIK